MVAESISARRPPFGRASARRPLRALITAPAIALALALSPLAAALPASASTSPMPTQLHAVADAAGVVLTIAPATSATVSAGQNLAVSVRIENQQNSALGAGTVNLSVEGTTINDRAGLDDWLGGTTDPAIIANTAVVSMPTGAVAAGGSLELQLSVPAAAMPSDSRSGPLGLSASLSVAETPIANDRSAIVWQGPTVVPAQPLTIVVPITTPARTSGLIEPDDLADYTGPSGTLTTQLDAVLGRGVTLGVDPAIIASIRVLGSSVPESALAWLMRLGSSGLPMFALAYADADLAVQAQSGLPATLAAAGLPINAELFADFTPTPSPTPTTTPTASETPGDSKAQTIPNSEELLAWPWTLDAIAWPASNTLNDADPAVLAASGYTSMLLDSGNVDGFLAGASAPHTTIDGVDTVVADAGASALLGAAASATSEIDWRSATAELASTLAVSGESGTLLAVPRGDAASGSRFSRVLDTVATLPWATPSSLSSALTSPASAALSIAPAPEGPERVSLVGRMLALEAPIAEFATVLEHPAALTDSVRLELLALLSNAWLPAATGWADVGNAFVERTLGVTRSISFVEGSPVNVLASTAEVPITIQNSFDQAVNVVITVVPTNGRLIVDGDVKIVIQPQSQSTVRIPVTARIGSGDVTLNATALSPSGVRLGTTSVNVNVQADWEGIGALVVAILAVLFFGFGVVRTIRRRRALRTTEAPAPAQAPAPESTRE